ncbi:CDP-diacylglycerol--serine O-phosphatidyltransferase [Talaromyces pinophilus]|nr:CDP-diacylglycerol--serine O-phosphatidyltransferase [Talaromyces pinophilus]
MSFRGGGRGRGRGGYQQSFGPPAEVLEMGSFMHACEGEIVCESINPKIPYFNAPIYLENKTPVGKVDEVLGPINQVYFTIKPQEGIVATSFKSGDKFYIGGDKLLPLEKFLPKPKAPPGSKVRKPAGGRGGAPRGGRGGRGAPRGGARGGRGAPGGFRGRGGGADIMSRRTPSHSPSEPSTGNGVGGDVSQEKQKSLLQAEKGHFTMVRTLHLADLITELNVMSVLSSMRYLSEPESLNNIWFALAFMPFGLFFDFMDGRVARWRKKSSLMGQELDSLADLISFGVAPAVAAFALGMRTLADHLFLSFFVLCGLTRLARFNVTAAVLPKDKSGKSKYFEGTPIPTSLSIASLMAYWVSQGWIHENLPYGTVLQDSVLEFHPVVLLFAVWGCLMVSKTLRIPKP